MSDPPVSWLLVEAGWNVVAEDGTEVGTIDEVVGDAANDIFDGLAVLSGLLEKPLYVPAEVVGTITQGRVELQLDRAGVERLAPYEEPATSAEILPGKASLLQRAEGATMDPVHRERRVSIVRRLWVRFLRMRRGRD